MSSNLYTAKENDVESDDDMGAGWSIYAPDGEYICTVSNDLMDADFRASLLLIHLNS